MTPYLFPNACVHCRKSFKKPKSDVHGICPECGGKTVTLNRKFSIPKTSDIEQWRSTVSAFRVSERRADGGSYEVRYPKTLAEAKDFVLRYHAQTNQSAT